MSKKDKSKRTRALLSDYQSLFNSPTGKKVLWDLMKQSRMLETTLDPDPLRMAFNEGGRNVILHIIKRLKIDIRELDSRIEEGNDNDREFWSD